MGIADLIVAVTLALMAAAIVVDRARAAPAAGGGPAPRPAEAAGAEQSAAVAPLPAWPDLAGLGGLAEGWAVLGPNGNIVATNLPERAALLAGACAMLRLASGLEGGAAAAWRTVRLEGPSGMLLGEAAPSGAVLAVLARRGADAGAIRHAMGQALTEVERRWDELAPGAGEQEYPAVPAGLEQPGTAEVESLPAGETDAPAGLGQDPSGLPAGGAVGAYLPLD